MSEDSGGLDEETQTLLERAAELSDIEKDEVNVEELVQKLAKFFIEEQVGAEEQLSDEIQQRQKFFKQRIFENL